MKYRLKKDFGELKKGFEFEGKIRLHSWWCLHGYEDGAKQHMPTITEYDEDYFEPIIGSCAYCKGTGFMSAINQKCDECDGTGSKDDIYAPVMQHQAEEIKYEVQRIYNIINKLSSQINTIKNKL